MFTTKKNSAMKTGGMTTATSLGTARSARPAIEVRSWTKPAGFPRMISFPPATTVASVSVVMVVLRDVVCVEAGASEIEEHIVECRRAQGELVGERPLGVVHEARGEVEPASHAARVGLDPMVEGVAEVEELREMLDARGDRARRQAVQRSLQPEQLRAGLLRVQRNVLQRR